jgi:hypothetical protein
MSDLLQWLDLAREGWGYLEPAIRKRELISAMIRRGKSEKEAQWYIQNLEFMKSDAVAVLIKLPNAEALLAEDPVFQIMMPLVFEVIFDDEYAQIWFKNSNRIERMRRLIVANKWTDIFKKK